MKFKKIFILSLVISSFFIFNLGTSYAMDVSWYDFKDLIYEQTGEDLDELIAESQNATSARNFRSDFDNARGMLVYTDWYWTVTPNKNSPTEKYIYFLFRTRYIYHI